MNEFGLFLSTKFNDFLTYTGVACASYQNLIMILVGIIFIWLAIKKDFEPLLLIPIGLGIILGNIPFKAAGLEIGLYEDNSVLNFFYSGVKDGWYPPLIFLGIGAMTDFTALIANPKLLLIGGAAQFGIFGAYMLALLLGFEPNQAAGIAIIGGADGPTAIFLSSKLSPNLMGAIAVCAYSYMALVPVIQPPLMRLLTTKKERVIRMKPARQVSQTERIIFPDCRFAAYHFHCAFGPSVVGYALLRKSFEGKHKDHAPCQNCGKRFERYHCDASWPHGGLFHSGERIPYARHHIYIYPWCALVHHRYVIGRFVRENNEPLLGQRQ